MCLLGSAFLIELTDYRCMIDLQGGHKNLYRCVGSSFIQLLCLLADLKGLLLLLLLCCLSCQPSLSCPCSLLI